LPLDLGIARCRIVVAAADPEIMTRSLGMLRVATKYSRIAATHFGARGIPVEIIQLSGSVELALWYALKGRPAQSWPVVGFTSATGTLEALFGSTVE